MTYPRALALGAAFTLAVDAALVVVLISAGFGLKKSALTRGS